jgi:hypothetical protein
MSIKYKLVVGEFRRLRRYMINQLESQDARTDKKWNM